MRADEDVLLRRHRLEQPQRLEGPHDAGGGEPPGSAARQVAVVDRHPATGRRHGSAGEVDDAGLARAVGTQQRHGLSPLDPEGDPVDREHSAERATHVGEDEAHVRGRRRGTRAKAPRR